jgi:flagellar motor switch protein FliN/FliY
MAEQPRDSLMNQQDETTTEISNAAETVTTESPSAPPLSGGQSQAAPLLMGVRLPIRVLLGRTQLSLRQITELGNGAVVELDCSPNDPVQIMVNDRVIAYGEIVMVAGNYGIRITKIPTREDNSEAFAPDNDLLRLSEKLR